MNEYLEQKPLIEQPSWSYEDMRGYLSEFLEIYSQSPIKDNQGGMQAPHMFATYYMLKKLAPKNVIESGIWKGQGTWLIEQTLPSTKIHSIDINLELREYLSPKVTYHSQDFSTLDWDTLLEEKESTVLFFDDHQNAFERVKTCKKLGFKHLIFEDNYPITQGDCYSLKKAFAGVGFSPQNEKKGGTLSKLFSKSSKGKVLPNLEDAKFLTENLTQYLEFPPVVKLSTTRWGDAWTESLYPTPSPLYSLEDLPPHLKVFQEEGKAYTWICYARL
ncbi:MAG: hypothetical protein AAF694_14185 [Bacteroidota bacterium]